MERRAFRLSRFGKTKPRTRGRAKMSHAFRGAARRRGSGSSFSLWLPGLDEFDARLRVLGVRVPVIFVFDGDGSVEALRAVFGEDGRHVAHALTPMHVVPTWQRSMQ